MPTLLGVTSVLLTILVCRPGQVSAYEAVSHHQGTSNLILTVPHTGHLKPSCVAKRRTGCLDENCNCKFGRKKCKDIGIKNKHCKTTAEKKCKINGRNDMNIQKKAIDVYNELTRQGIWPHMVINNIHRSRLDQNRDEEEAAQGNAYATKAYKKYHSTIEQIKESFGGSPGLILDFHRQVICDNTIEIGYLVSKEDLNAGTYERLKKSKLSIRSLVERVGWQNGMDLISGNKSMGALFEKNRYTALPSNKNKSPGKRRYYNGGYTVLRHGTNEEGKVDAIQLEFPSEEGRTKKERTDLIPGLVDVIKEYMAEYYEGYWTQEEKNQKADVTNIVAKYMTFECKKDDNDDWLID